MTTCCFDPEKSLTLDLSLLDGDVLSRQIVSERHNSNDNLSPPADDEHDTMR